MTIIWEVDIVVLISRMFGVITNNVRRNPIVHMVPFVKASNTVTVTKAPPLPRIVFSMSHIEVINLGKNLETKRLGA